MDSRVIGAIRGIRFNIVIIAIRIIRVIRVIRVVRIRVIRDMIGIKIAAVIRGYSHWDIKVIRVWVQGDKGY